MLSQLVGIYRYPVKGLSPERRESVEVEAGSTLPLDRAWAIENGPSRFDSGAPRHLAKICFLMLMRDERLATLRTEFDEATSRLTIFRGGKKVASGELGTQTGRLIIEQFMAAYMAESLRGPPKIVSAPGHSFTDASARRVHIVNLASLREIERVSGRNVDPLRFRPNLVVDGLDPWAEFTWIGREIAVGAVRLKVHKRTERCAATNVDPATGARDMDIPALLARKWGHLDFGVYAEILTPGHLSVGDPVTMSAHAPADAV